MSEPREAQGWTFGELGGGLLFSTDGFILQLSAEQVDRFIEVLNSGSPGTVVDINGDMVHVYSPERDNVILKRVGDRIYPGGIILPVDVFSEVDDEPIIEGIRPAFRRVGSKIKRGFRVTSGRRKGRVVVDPKTANKPPIAGNTRAKLRAAAKRKKLIRALKAKLTRRKSASIRLRRMNHT